MYEDIRFRLATLLEVIGITMIFGFVCLSLLPSTLHMRYEAQRDFWKNPKNWSFPGTRDTKESLAKLSPYERRSVLILALLIGGVVLLNVGQAMGGALRAPDPCPNAIGHDAAATAVGGERVTRQPLEGRPQEASRAVCPDR